MWIDSHIWMKDHCLHQLYSCLCGFCDMIASFFFQEKKAKNQKTLLAPSRMYCMLQGIYIENTSSCVRNSRLQNVTMNIYLFKLFKWLECKASLAAFFLALSRKKKRYFCITTLVSSKLFWHIYITYLPQHYAQG